MSRLLFSFHFSEESFKVSTSTSLSFRIVSILLSPEFNYYLFISQIESGRRGGGAGSGLARLYFQQRVIRFAFYAARLFSEREKKGRGGREERNYSDALQRGALVTLLARASTT